MPIYKHMVRKAPENLFHHGSTVTDHIEIWLDGHSEDGWELVTSTHINGVVNYVFRKPITVQ